MSSSTTESVLAASRREVPAGTATDPFGALPFPQTVSARRNARLRAAALATIPLLLFVAAALLRLWAPDLVPFGVRQATSVQEAVRRAPVTWSVLYADHSLPAYALLAPLLGELPSPIAIWVTLRGLADALGIALLYLAARPVVGTVGAALAGLLYAASPVAWAAARDPAGTFGPVLMAAALWAAVRLAARPTLLRGAVLGLMLGLLARSLPFGLLVVPLGAVALAFGRTSWRVGGLTALGLVVAAGSALFAGAHLPAGPADLPPIPAGDPLRPMLGELALMPGWLVPPLALLLASGTAPRLGNLRRLSFTVVRWATLTVIALLLAGEIVLLGLTVRGAERESRERSAFAMTSPGESAAWAGAPASLRDWTALSRTIREVAQRIDAEEIVVFDGNPMTDVLRRPDAVLHGDVRPRQLVMTLVLPLERETAYLIPSGPGLPVELQRPSSATTVFTETERASIDTGARIVTLRPRPAADWLARVRPVTAGRFADGSALVGLGREASATGNVDLRLYWELPAAADGRAVGERVRFGVRRASDGQTTGQTTEIELPAVPARRSGELVVTRLTLQGMAADLADSVLLVSLFDASGRPIRTAAGAVDLDVPLGSPRP